MLRACSEQIFPIFLLIYIKVKFFFSIYKIFLNSLNFGKKIFLFQFNL